MYREITLQEILDRGIEPSYVAPELGTAVDKIRAAGWTPAGGSLIRADGSICAFSEERQGARIPHPCYVVEYRYGQFWTNGSPR